MSTLGALADLSLTETNVDDLIVPGNITHRDRGDQHLAAAQPPAGFDDHVAYGPALVIEVDILHLADFPIGCAHGEVVQFFHGM